MDDLIFTPLNVCCPRCRAFVRVSIEGLRYEDEVICDACNLNFTPKIDVDALLKLMKAAETGEFKKVVEQESEELE